MKIICKVDAIQRSKCYAKYENLIKSKLPIALKCIFQLL